MRGVVNGAYFGLSAPGDEVPTSVLLTEPAADLAFSSLALKAWVGDPSDGVGVYKLFSRYVLRPPCASVGVGVRQISGRAAAGRGFYKERQVR